jgi:hypothetical protein
MLYAMLFIPFLLKALNRNHTIVFGSDKVSSDHFVCFRIDLEYIGAWTETASHLPSDPVFKISVLQFGHDSSFYVYMSSYVSSDPGAKTIEVVLVPSRLPREARRQNTEESAK